LVGKANKGFIGIWVAWLGVGTISLMIFSVYLPTIWSEGFGLFEEVEVQILLFNMPLFVFMK
jgi:hypothetical protein